MIFMLSKLMEYYRGNETMQFRLLTMSDAELRRLYFYIFEWREGYGQYE